MRDIVVAEAPRGAIRVLDLGCGTGGLVRRLADALPEAALVGIDVSPANIDAAGTMGPPAPRARFEVADYLRFRSDPFDLIVSDGVLHLVRGDSGAIASKLAADLRPGGILVCDMPYSCAYNRVFAVVRRLLRLIRTPMLDRAILAIARLLHGRDMDESGLRERVSYMYIPPERVMDERLARTFAAAGLRRRAEYPAPNTSLSQLKHRVTVFERDVPAR
jgi:SAM-dependent methyltransferase